VSFELCSAFIQTQGAGGGVRLYRSFACTCPTQEIYNMKKEERPERKKRKPGPYFRLADWE
jgi:hypothetical protein